MTSDSNECPAGVEEIAEAYILDKLTSDQVIAFEEHYIACDRCAMILQKTADFIEALRAVAEDLPPETPN